MSDQSSSGEEIFSQELEIGQGVVIHDEGQFFLFAICPACLQFGVREIPTFRMNGTVKEVVCTWACGGMTVTASWGVVGEYPRVVDIGFDARESFAHLN